jgi:uncharacterized iron-regulated membrane protein
MGNKIITMFLVMAVLGLLMPLTQELLAVENAFTVDNLVRIELPAE